MLIHLCIHLGLQHKDTVGESVALRVSGGDSSLCFWGASSVYCRSFNFLIFVRRRDTVDFLGFGFFQA